MGARLTRSSLPAGCFVAGALTLGCLQPTIGLSDFGDRRSAAACATATTCGEYPDVPTCLAAIELDESQLMLDTAASRIFYDPPSALACVNALGSTRGLGSCSLTDRLSAGEPTACRETLVGLVATGDPCFVDDECASRACDRSACGASEACCAGACAPPAVLIPIGADCATPGATCTADAACVQGAAGQASTCGRKAGPGQSCADSSGCQAESLCIVPPGASRGVCGRLPGHGAPCRPGAALACDRVSDYCDATTETCTARSGPGGACASDDGCVAYATCDGRTRTCVTKGLVGALCTSSTECLGSLQCLIGICNVPPAAAACPWS